MLFDVNVLDAERQRITKLLQNKVPRLDETFDMVFIDADKRLYSEYYDLVFPMVRPGGLILADNTLWDGHTPGLSSASLSETVSIKVFPNTERACPKYIAPVAIP